MFTALFVYVIHGFAKEWMPHPEENYFSWAFWFQMATTFSCFISGKFK